MEIFRRLGLAAKMRDAGLPAGLSATTCLPHLGDRARSCRASTLPSRAGRYRGEKGPTTAGGRRRSRRIASTSLSSSRCCSRTPRRSRASAFSTAPSSRASRRTSTASSAGARSRQRRAHHDRLPLSGRLRRRPLGRAQGDRRRAGRRSPVVQRVQSTYFRAPELMGLLPGKPALDVSTPSIRAAAAP